MWALQTQKLWLILYCFIPIKKRQNHHSVLTILYSTLLSRFLIGYNFHFHYMGEWTKSSAYNFTHIWCLKKYFDKIIFWLQIFQPCLPSLPTNFQCQILEDAFKLHRDLCPSTFVSWSQESWLLVEFSWWPFLLQAGLRYFPIPGSDDESCASIILNQN